MREYPDGADVGTRQGVHMYANVTIGIDGAQGGWNAAALAAALADRDAVMTLVFVCLPNVRGGSALELAQVEDRMLWGLLEREVELSGGRARICRVTADSVGAGLEQAAADTGSDLIVVGASNRHGVARLWLGDDARSVLRTTPRTVAVVPPSYEHKPNILARIGVAYDGSPESEVAIAHAGLIAQRRNSELIVRHVVGAHSYPLGVPSIVPPVVTPASELEAAGARLSEVDGLTVEHAYGLPREQLVEFSKSVDLLVCGSRHNGPLGRLTNGSTSHYLARHSEAPLLITPSIDTQAVMRWRAERQALVG
jgi:nucleotide-binding universal stress UspA family protein